jgi:hypothetical protein
MSTTPTTTPEPTGTRRNPDTGLVELTYDQPKDPRWDSVRSVTANLKNIGHQLMRGPIVLGMLLATLKKEHHANGGGRGGDRKSMGGFRPLIDWATLVERESGYSRRQADDFIRTYDAFLPKLRSSKKLKIPGLTKKDAIILFDQSNPLALTEEQWSQVDSIIASLTTAESMTGLMQELGILPKPKPMPKGTKDVKGNDDDDTTAGQLAFHFFEAMVSPLINSRTNPEYKKLLYALPVTSTEDHPLSLATLESECRAMLADIDDAKQAAAKPAKGRVINA